jgi:hypothetical protein
VLDTATTNFKSIEFFDTFGSKLWHGGRKWHFEENLLEILTNLKKTQFITKLWQKFKRHKYIDLI